MTQIVEAYFLQPVVLDGCCEIVRNEIGLDALTKFVHIDKIQVILAVRSTANSPVQLLFGFNSDK